MIAQSQSGELKGVIIIFIQIKILNDIYLIRNSEI